MRRISLEIHIVYKLTMNNNVNPNVIQALLIERAIASKSPSVVQPPSEQYLHIARLAAQRAADFRRLASTAKVEGFKPLSLPDYLALIAIRSGVNLARVLPPSAEQTSPTAIWIGLAKSVGLSLHRIRLHLRMWVAECFESEESVPSLARGMSKNLRHSQTARYRGLSESQIESLLSSVESGYTPKAQAHLAACLRELD